jgi:hypothetical protein
VAAWVLVREVASIREVPTYVAVSLLDLAGKVVNVLVLK